MARYATTPASKYNLILYCFMIRLNVVIVSFLLGLLLQDMEVTYFQTFIDGVDFVFIESPKFRHLENNIYGGNRMVRYLFS